MARRRRRRAPARCGDCKSPIAWFSFHGSWRKFDPKPIDTSSHLATYPVEGKRAWRAVDLVEELMGRLSCSRTDAEDHVDAMPHHVLHACPPDSHRKDPDR